jgi:putative inorganic carbon (hco3(-)) transporter
MTSKHMINLFTRVIEYSFYSLFFLTPFLFTNLTSELFELNKMWFVWILTIIIIMSWIIKMVLQRRILFCRTPLDIPIALFLLFQIISTIFSLEPHTSFWGYYSRFNGGLLSIASYIVLYYAFLSNLSNLSYLRRILFFSLVSGLIVVLWGLPSHFGYDPTCFVLRGTLDTSCWTQDFMPTVRIFSTLGQPGWLAAYLAILIPISFAFILKNPNHQKSEKLMFKYSEVLNLRALRVFRNKIHTSPPAIAFAKRWRAGSFIILTSLFYLALLYTGTKSGFLALLISITFLAVAYFVMKGKKLFAIRNSRFAIIVSILLVITFIIGTPFSQLNFLTLNGIKNQVQKTQTPAQDKTDELAPRSSALQNEGGTDSGQIRLHVWEGAVNAWKDNPLIGTGVETFAHAHYKYKPVDHNLTSEWNFLYNKAHNEYLNYLATTGIFGLGTYLLLIGFFLYLVIRKISKSEFLISNQIPNLKSQLGQLEIRSIRNLTLALIASYISILITNFFGFSVVITNLYLFLIPAFVFVLTGIVKQKEEHPMNINKISIYQSISIFFIVLISLFLIYGLIRFWRADVSYALGYNLSRAGEYQEGYSHLQKAISLRSSEPAFKNEFSVNNAIIASALMNQANTQDEQTALTASFYAEQAIRTSDEVISKYPNNASFWKTRVRLFYALSQVDSSYLSNAMDSIKQASALAPNDPTISYNLGVLYGQAGDIEKAVDTLERTINLKQDYRDAHFALGLFYRTLATDDKGKIVDERLNQKAIQQMEFIIKNLNLDDKQALESLDSWQN